MPKRSIGCSLFNSIRLLLLCYTTTTITITAAYIRSTFSYSLVPWRRIRRWNGTERNGTMKRDHPRNFSTTATTTRGIRHQKRGESSSSSSSSWRIPLEMEGNNNISSLGLIELNKFVLHRATPGCIYQLAEECDKCISRARSNKRKKKSLCATI